MKLYMFFSLDLDVGRSNNGGSSLCAGSSLYKMVLWRFGAFCVGRFMGKRKIKTEVFMAASTSRSLLVFVPCCLVFVLAAQSHAEEGTQLADPLETMKAVKIALELGDEALAYDGAGGSYPDEYFEKVVGFYKYGSGTAQEPGDSIVTRRFCREYAIGLLSDLFSAEENEPNEEDDRTLKNPLNQLSKERADAAVTVMLISAREDLTPLQRGRLIDLAAKWLTNDNRAALRALRMLAESPEVSSLEQSLITRTVEAIEDRPPSSLD